MAKLRLDKLPPELAPLAPLFAPLSELAPIVAAAIDKSGWRGRRAVRVLAKECVDILRGK